MNEPSVSNRLSAVSALSESLIEDRIRLAEMELKDVTSALPRLGIFLFAGAVMGFAGWICVAALLVVVLQPFLTLIGALGAVAGVQMLVALICIRTGLRAGHEIGPALKRLKATWAVHPGRALETSA